METGERILKRPMYYKKTDIYKFINKVYVNTGLTKMNESNQTQTIRDENLVFNE